MSFKWTTQAYLLKRSITPNKYLIPLLYLLINCTSARSALGILSLKEEYSFRLLNFLVIGLWSSSASQTFQVPRFWFVSPGLPVYKRKSPGFHQLIKSPGFFTFISRFFAVRLLFCISPNFLYRKIRIESPVIHYRFWIGFLFTSDQKFRRWNHFQNGIEKCTRRFIELVW